MDSKNDGFKLVIIESPYLGDVDRNVAYARACLRDSLKRGEAPYASHLLYTQPGVLRDHDPAERERGINAGLAWGRVADLTAVYSDLGITDGMRRGMARADEARRPWEERKVADWLVTAPRDPRSIRVEELMDDLRVLYRRKQLDYGTASEPFANLTAAEDLAIPAWKMATARLLEKATRIRQLIRNGRAANEPITDSFMDMAVYSLIALALFEEHGPEASEDGKE